MVVDDLFTLEELRTVAASPDGELLAVVITRAASAATMHRDFLFRLDQADIWLASRRGGELRNLTSGVGDGSGYWNPVWSPDGRRLAMLSTRGGHEVRPHVYDLASGELRRLTDRVADLEAHGPEGWPTYAMLWKDSTTLLCAVRAEGVPPSDYWLARTRSLSGASRAWEKAERGREPTASVLESGVAPSDTAHPDGALLEIDVVSGRSGLVAAGNFRQLLLSPTRQHLALLTAAGRIPPRRSNRLPYEVDGRYNDHWRTRLGILSMGNDAQPKWVEGVFDPRPAIVEPTTTLSWSPDGSALAVVSKAEHDSEKAATIFVVSPSTGTARRATSPALEILETAWSQGGLLLGLGRPSVRSMSDSAQSRLDWWRIDWPTTRTATNLTARLRSVPSLLMRGAEGHVMLGVADGDVWSVDLLSRVWRNATSAFLPVIRSTEWPTPATLRRRLTSEVVVRTEGNDLYRLSWTNGNATAALLPRPSGAAKLVDLRPARHLSVFTAEQANGTFLWMGDERSAQFGNPTIVLNRHLADLADARLRLIDYRGLEGDSQKALLLLPAGYEPGRKYPLIAWVYPGFALTDTVFGDLFQKSLVSSLNRHLLPAQGYAVLAPSIPLEDPRIGSDPYMDIQKSVVSAVDRAIDLGIADPDRLGLIGHSYGGYAVYAIATYTQRFKAAVAIAGFADLPSIYGTFEAPTRYDGAAHEDLFFAALSESGQIRMGKPPWGDLWRYLRNSPLFYVDRVSTPVMIIHGDIDYVPLQQAEEFFTALYRLGRRATFVRYWGEGHIISAPANVRDMWQRIFAWFDEHVRDQGLSHIGRMPSTSAGAP